MHQGAEVPEPFSRTAIAAGMVISAFLIAGASLVSWQNLRLIQDVARSQSVVQSLAQEVEHANEGLTLTAQLAVLTTDPQHEQRYEQLHQRFEKAAKGLAAAIMIPANDRSLQRLLEADRRLVEMERRAIALSRRGSRPQAEAVLESNGYLECLRIVEEEAENIYRRARARILETDERAKAIAVATLIWAAVLFAALMLVWLLVMRRLRTWGLEQRRLQKEAASAAEAKAQFMAAMSHEIRTPLTGVIGMADVLIAEDLPAPQKRMVAAIRSSGRHLLAVVNDVLDYARLEADAVEVEQSPFSIEELLENVLSVANPLAMEKGLSLKTEVAGPTRPQLIGDARRLTQVLLNLVGNAIKFAERGEVVIRVAPSAAADDRLHVRFEVEDTGPGIAPEEHARLFEPFTQADRGSTRQHGGSGLGLAISKRLVEAMGGEIGVVSSPGQGSCFWFQVPLRVADAAEGTPKNAPVREIAPRNILIAEDVELNRDLLKTVLAKQGHSITLVHDGAQAVEAAAQHEYDVILMDIQMPRMDGVEATRLIRNSKGPNTATPILALSANVLPAERKAYLAAGMNVCLSKPIDWDQLTSAIADQSSRSAVTATRSEQASGRTSTLVDWDLVERLDCLGMGDDLKDLLQRALDTAIQAHDAMSAMPERSAELAREAHSTKGSCAMMGFVALAQICNEIERKAAEGREVGPLLASLRETIASTRAEVERGDSLRR